MEVRKPVFIIGSGRSGSTILHETISKHPNVRTLNVLHNMFPQKNKLNNFLTTIKDIYPFSLILNKVLKPDEAYNFWEHYAKGFRRPLRDLGNDDLSIKNKKSLQKVFSNIILRKRNLLLLKLTGWPRIGYLKELYPDAKFIYISRDPRAIANSFLNVGFWKGWEGPYNWRFGQLSQDHFNEWEKHNKSFHALAGIAMKVFNDALQNAKAKISNDDYYELKYEDLCKNPIEAFKNLTDFCELKVSAKFNKKVKNIEFRNTNNKWKKELTEKQKDILEDVLSPLLEKYR